MSVSLRNECRSCWSVAGQRAISRVLVSEYETGREYRHVSELQDCIIHWKSSKYNHDQQEPRHHANTLSDEYTAILKFDNNIFFNIFVSYWENSFILINSFISSVEDIFSYCSSVKILVNFSLRFRLCFLHQECWLSLLKLQQFLFQFCLHSRLDVDTSGEQSCYRCYMYHL